MSCPPSKAKFQLRRDTATNWTNANPLVLAGEPGFEIDTNKLKIGDGNKRWVDLSYIGDCPLVFSVINPSVRELTGYKENNKTLTVRSAEITGNMFYLNLASFTPTLTVNAVPSTTLNWDIPCTGFNISVTNPSDYDDEYISDVNDTIVVPATGVFSTLDKFTASPKSATPAPKVNWTQSFATNANAFIRPISTTINGGTTAAVVSFKYMQQTNQSVYSDTRTLAINWITPTNSISTTPLSGKTFLETYTSTTYSLSVSGLSTSNYTNALSSTGGTIDNTTGPGIFTFEIPVHKDNVGLTRQVTLITTFNRPASVTGTAYSAQLTKSAGITATFRYPSFYVFTISRNVVPTANDIISGISFKTGVTSFGDQTKTFAAYVDNTSTDPRGIWFGFRSSASQPTLFQVGDTPQFMNTVEPVTGNTVNLAPIPLTYTGYTAESYTLYGFTLQNGISYISIS